MQHQAGHSPDAGVNVGRRESGRTWAELRGVLKGAEAEALRGVEVDAAAASGVALAAPLAAVCKGVCSSSVISKSSSCKQPTHDQIKPIRNLGYQEDSQNLLPVSQCRS